MDKIEKALRKLSPKEQKILRLILLDILKRNFLGLDVKKLKGRENVYRVRKGAMRIIFQIKGDQILLLTLERRSDTTYE